MLVLSRKADERIVIGDDIIITPPIQIVALTADAQSLAEAVERCRVQRENIPDA